MMAKRTFRPKKGYEGARLTLSLPDSAEALVVEEWPHETEEPTEQAALGSHPWVTDQPLPESKKSDSKKKEK
jgi:hypothetical protein